MYLLAITAAAKSIHLSSAYFVPDDLTLKALVAAARRGVRVKIITPGEHMSDATRKRYFAGETTANATTELGNKAAKGAGVGGAIGGTIGAIAAAVAAVGTSLVIPGLGLVVAGPLAAALAGGGAGAAGGGLIGALVGWGIPEERVKHYEAGIKEGGILMGVTPRSDADAHHFEEAWGRSGEHEAV